jgi:hypothetical protein
MKKNEIILYQKLVLINLIVIGISLLFIMLTTYGCNEQENPNQPNQDDKGDYSIVAKYDSIRSYPGGGGIFIVYITPDKDFSGTVILKLEADKSLNAFLRKTTLDNKNCVAEIVISPEKTINIKKYNIRLIASHEGKEKNIELGIDLYEWQQGEIETPLSKLNEFRDWLNANYPKYNALFGKFKTFYHTYPEILIVEHYTFLTDEYEIRLCYHVMIPPDDWSMILFRKRDSIKAEFAARRDTDGKIYSIPVSDYPLLLGY